MDAACTQTVAAATNTVTPATTFFTTIIPNAKTICISAWDLSSDIDTALELRPRTTVCERHGHHTV